MTPDRFAALAAAYGADLDRWPETDRDAARQHLSDTPQAASVLSRERDLDVALAAYGVAAPTADRQRQVVTALRRRRAERENRGRWLSRLGMLGALAAGAALGVSAMSLLYLQPANAPNGEAANPLYEQTSFGDLTSSDDFGAVEKGS
jgi:hypothetical protein